MELKNVMDAAHQWLAAVKEEYGKQLSVETLQDTETLFRVIFESEYHVAELMVNEPGFAPYRFVSFQVLSVNVEIGDEPVYSYYDGDTDTLQDIIKQLNFGVSITAFPFEDAPNTAAITCCHVIEEDRPILFVSHDEEDGMWQFLCGEKHGENEAKIVSLCEGRSETEQ